jgi:hypothetical protein
MPLSKQVNKMKEAFNVRYLFHQRWEQNKENSSSNSFTIMEVTYGLATKLQFCC